MYDDFETKTSYTYLQTVVESLKEPVCILGGWAVFFLVNKNYKEATGKDYLGSRDIDIGFHLEKDWSKQRMQQSPLADSLAALKKLGFVPLSFRLVKSIDRETGEEAQKLPLHQQFQMSVDPIVDIIPKNFKEAFGFQPIDEPLLRFAFEGHAQEMEQFGKKLLLPSPELLLATKLHSIKNRDKKDKKIKDFCDIFALLWHAGKPPQVIAKKCTLFNPHPSLEWDQNEIETIAPILGHSSDEIRKVISIIPRRPS